MKGLYSAIPYTVRPGKRLFNKAYTLYKSDFPKGNYDIEIYCAKGDCGTVTYCYVYLAQVCKTYKRSRIFFSVVSGGADGSLFLNDTLFASLSTDSFYTVKVLIIRTFEKYPLIEVRKPQFTVYTRLKHVTDNFILRVIETVFERCLTFFITLAGYLVEYLKTMLDILIEKLFGILNSINEQYKITEILICAVLMYLQTRD